MNRLIPILLYHAIGPVPGKAFEPYTVTRAVFARHLELLGANGYTTITVDDLVTRFRHGRPCDGLAAVTFDDGFASFADEAWPELLLRSMPATLYVATSAIGGRPRWLDDIGCGTMPMLEWDQLRKLRDEGCEIGAHTVNHPQLDCLAPSAADDEIRASRDALTRELDQPVATFAYPHGYHDRHTRQLVVDAGFVGACAVKNSLSHSGDDPFALARVTITSDMTDHDVARVLDGTAVRLAPARERLRTAVHRAVRRRRHRDTVQRTATSRNEV